MSRVDSRNNGAPPPNITEMYSLKVDNLTYRTSVEDLKRTFSKYGRVGDVYIPRDPIKQESRGFAFVRFYDKRDARDAIDYLDGANLDGRPLRVAMAKYDRPDNPRAEARRKYGNAYPSGRYGGGGRRRRSRSRSYDRRRRSYSRSRSPSESRRRSRSRSPSNRSRSRSRTRSSPR